MDIKNSRGRYCETAGASESLLPKIEQSIAFLLSGKVDYEFRTTVVQELHDEVSIQDMGVWVQSCGNGQTAKRWYLQRYTDRESVRFAGLHAPEVEKMQIFAEKLTPFSELVSLRGVD